MHSENKEDSEKLVEIITQFITYAKERNYKDCIDTMASFLKAAQTFTQILTVYGRFPHRNALLNRKDTPDEIEYNKRGKIPDYKLQEFGFKAQSKSATMKGRPSAQNTPGSGYNPSRMQ